MPTLIPMHKLFASLVLSLLALVAAAPAHAAYPPPVKVGDQGFNPRAFADSSGGGTVVWTTSAGLEAVRFAADLAAGPTVALTTSGSNVPVAAGTGAGDVYAADREDLADDDSQIVISHLAPDGSVDTNSINDPTTVDNDPEVATGRTGGPVLAWDAVTNDFRQPKVHLARLSPSGAVESEIELGNGFLPKPAVDDGGNVGVGWPSGNRILVTTVTASNQIAKPAAVQRADRERLTAVAWGKAPQPIALIEKPYKELRVVRFGNGRPKSRPIASATLVKNSTVAVDGKGAAWIAWTQRTGRGVAIRTRRMSPTGKLGPALTLSQPGTEVGAPQLAAGRNGASVAWWSDGEKKGQSIRVAELTPRDKAPAPKTVFSTTVTSIHTLSIAIDSEGRNLVSWYQQGGGVGGVYLSREG